MFFFSRVIPTQDENDMVVPTDTKRILIVKTYRYKDREALKEYISTAKDLGYKSIGSYSTLISPFLLVAANPVPHSFRCV